MPLLDPAPLAPFSIADDQISHDDTLRPLGMNGGSPLPFQHAPGAFENRIDRGKGGRYRNAMLSEDLLLLLRQWWKVGRQQGVMHRDGWLFPGLHAMKPISTHQLYRDTW